MSGDNKFILKEVFDLLGDDMTITISRSLEERKMIFMIREKKDFKEQKVSCTHVQWEDLELMKTDWIYIFRDLIIGLEELK
jgi:hypothetical protein